MTPIEKRESMPIINGQKVCTKCRMLKPVDDFYKRMNGSIQSWCKPCMVENDAKNVARRRASADSKA